MAAVIQGAYIQGVSTRSVDELVKAMGMAGISKNQVSPRAGEIDERVHAFLDRPLEGDWPYLCIDATYVKVREAGRIVSVAVIIAVALNTDGWREVLVMRVGPSEAEPFWTDFLRSLMRRGFPGRGTGHLRRHEALKAAVSNVLNATWQRCRVHFMRNVMAHVGKGQRTMVASLLRTVFAQDSRAECHLQLCLVADRLRDKYRKIATLMDGCEDEVLAHMALPKIYRQQLLSINPLERLNAEIKCRTDGLSRVW